MNEIGDASMAGRTVLITGGTGGIGKATALGLATMGARVAITGRNPMRAEDAVRAIRAAGGGKVDALVADMSSQSQARRLAEEILQNLPGSSHRSSTGPTRWPTQPRACATWEQGHARGKVAVTVA